MATARATNLTCEYQRLLLGTDETAPRFSWMMSDVRPGAAQTAYQVDVARDDSFAKGSIVWQTGERAGSRSLHIPYDGPPLATRTRYYWRVRVCDPGHEWSPWSDPAWFETALLGSGWQASWIGPPDVHGTERGPAPLVRVEFEAPAAPVRARLYASARGLMEVTINGLAVNDHRLSPGWTDYDYRSQYITADVTELVVSGTNAVGVMLGDGWYSGRIAQIRDGERRFGARPQFMGELHLDYADGSQQVVASDGTWRCSDGPVVASDIYDGEIYDARRAQAGWDEADFDAAAWKPVAVVGPANCRWDGSVPPEREAVDHPDQSDAFPAFVVDPRDDDGILRPVLDAKVAPAVRAVRELTPVAVTEPEPGRHVYDLGQNIAGWVRVTATGRAGRTVTLRFAEMLQKDGTLYVENLRSAKATDEYTFATDGTVTWEPRFTFHGFRYIEVSGVETAPAAEEVVGVVLYNDMEETGSFSCSSDLLNRLQSNIAWGQRGNFLEAPTDCPQRDERLGWTGDAQVFIPTASYIMNVAGFFTKWQRDLEDAQSPRGVVPSVAPAVRYMKPADQNDGGPAWSDAFVICPWTIRTRFDDLRLIERSYPRMRRFIESMRADSRGLIRSDEFVVRWGGYGDWVAMDAPEGSCVGATPKDLIGTAYFAYSTDLLRRMAEQLDRREDALELRDLHTRIVRAFRAEYLTSAGRLAGDTQTSYVLALAFDLLPEEYRQGAVDRLVRSIERREYRMTTGFVGTTLLCPVLTRFGRVDVAYRLLLQEKFPSWLYTVRQGATTMWERWNSYTHEHGFGPVSMNSFNHYAYGSIGAWMYRTVAGLEVDFGGTAGEGAPIRIAPRPGYGLAQAEAKLQTPLGPARSAWSIVDGTITLEVTVPANAWARAEIPAGLSDVEIDVAGAGDEHVDEFVVHEDTEGGILVFRLASGSYTFVWRETT